MERMPTKSAEDIYSILMRYAEASPRYYDKEGFIYSFGVIQNPPKKFRLNCIDGKRRIFRRDGNQYKLEGLGDSKINAIIKRILEDSEINGELN